MTPDELLRSEAGKWLAQAAKDRRAPEAYVFHSPQAAEKALKGFLTFHQIRFRKTHALTESGSQSAGADATLEPLLRQIEWRIYPRQRRRKGSRGRSKRKAKDER